MPTQLEEKRELVASELAQLEQIDAKAKEENRPYTDEEFKRSEEGMALVTQTNKEIETLTRSESLKQLLASKKSQVFGTPLVKVSKTAITNEDKSNAFKAWLTGDHEQYRRDKYVRAAELCGVDPSAKELFIRAQSTDTANEGIEFISDIATGVDAAMKNFGKVEQLSNLNIVDKCDTFHWTLFNDTSVESDKLGQNADVSGDAIDFDPLTFKYAAYKTGVIDVSLEAMEDVPNLVNLIQSALGERQARKLSKEYTDGTAASGNAGVGGYLHEAGEIDADSTGGGIELNDLLKLFGSVNADYRDNNDRCIWTMSDKTWIYLLQTLQTDDGKSLLGDFIDGPRGRLFGHPVIINNSMDDFSADDTSEQTPVAFGDQSRYLIARSPVRLVKTDNATELSANLLSYVRATGHITTKGDAIKKLVINGS